MSTETMSPLAERWSALRIAQPKLRIRDAAASLGVSEYELAALAVGREAVRLDGDAREILAAVPRLGRVMALTRNEHCVHERKGRYENLSFEGHVGLALGADIDLRIFVGSWRHALALTEDAGGTTRRSLHFFDAHGTAVHKIYLLQESDVAAFDGLVEHFLAADQRPGGTVTPAATTATQEHAVDVARFQADWDALQDTHDFFPMLRRHKLARRRALQLAGAQRAEVVPRDAGTRVLNAAAASGLPIMVFVGNHGMLQIHTGPVVRIVPMGPWINVLDPDFNLHLRESAVTEAWLVRKPTRDGLVTSVELFDADDQLIATFFGKRKPGSPEDPQWRALAEGLAGHVA